MLNDSTFSAEMIKQITAPDKAGGMFAASTVAALLPVKFSNDSKLSI